MKLFLDTANVADITSAAATGLIDGITTNPSLVAQAGRPFKDILLDIVALVDGPISAEVISTNSQDMLREAHSLAKIHDNITVKLPLIAAALPVVKQLAAEKIMTNVTLVFSLNQALLAAKAGATFVSPFIGRLDDIGEDGMALVQAMVQMYQQYDFTTQILVASVRHPLHVTQAARAGAQAATLPKKVFDQLVQHPLTDSGLKKFLEDWKTAKQKSI